MPQRWFAHFYMMGVLCAIAALALLLATNPAVTSNSQQGSHAALLTILCLLMHLSRRLVESVWLLNYPPDAHMHAIAYIFGLRCSPVNTLCVYLDLQRMNRLNRMQPQEGQDVRQQRLLPNAEGCKSHEKTPGRVHMHTCICVPVHDLHCVPGLCI